MHSKIYWHNVVECTKKFLGSSAYEKKFYREYIIQGGERFYCAEDPEIYLQGTRDSVVNKKKHSYLIYTIMPCQDKFRDPLVDPKCAPLKEIEDWLKYKKLVFKVINKQANFKSYKEESTKQTETWLQSVPLALNTYTDTGYRLQKNTFDKHDNWWPWGQST